MERYLLLIKNVGLLALSSFATKILSFLLVPLYTTVLSTTEYGIYDFFSTTVAVLLPILTINIQEGVLRYAMEKNFDRKAIITVGFRHILIGCIIVILGLEINAFFHINSLLHTYGIYFFLMFLSQALAGMVIFYARGVGRISDLSVSSVVTSIVTISLNIFLLVYCNWGLVGYFVANIVGPLAQCFYLMVKEQMVPALSLFTSYPAESKLMIAYSLPLVANSLAWWVNNFSDRYIVIFFCGLAANGIFSVASKIPSILAVLQNIFGQAWTLSAFYDFDPKDSKGFFANTYKVYNCMMTLLCSGIIISDKLLARFLYANDFYLAWKYVPWLTIAIMFGAMAGYLGGIFTAVKDSKLFAYSTMAGAAVNIILSVLLVPWMGPLGAALATCACYIVVWAYRLVQSRKYMTFRMNLIRDIISYSLLIAQAICLLMFEDSIWLYGGLCALFVGILLLYSHDIRLVIAKVLHR